MKDVTYTNAALALETTIGLSLKLDVSKKIALNAAMLWHPTIRLFVL